MNSWRPATPVPDVGCWDRVLMSIRVTTFLSVVLNSLALLTAGCGPSGSGLGSRFGVEVLPHPFGTADTAIASYDFYGEQIDHTRQAPGIFVIRREKETGKWSYLLGEDSYTRIAAEGGADNYIGITFNSNPTSTPQAISESLPFPFNPKATDGLIGVSPNPSSPQSSAKAESRSAPKGEVAQDLVFLGTVQEIRQSGMPRTAMLEWIIHTRVDKVVSGRFSGETFSFLVHSPSRSGLEKGKQYKIKAKWTGEGYRVNQNQWMQPANIDPPHSPAAPGQPAEGEGE